MGKQKLLILVVFLAVIGAVVSFEMLRSDGAPVGQGSGATPACRTVGAEGIRGISLQLHNGEPDHPYRKYVSLQPNCDATLNTHGSGPHCRLPDESDAETGRRGSYCVAPCFFRISAILR